MIKPKYCTWCGHKKIYDDSFGYEICKNDNCLNEYKQKQTDFRELPDIYLMPQLKYAFIQSLKKGKYEEWNETTSEYILKFKLL